MEGVGRLGRSSSRYGQSATAALFSGPVRKWKRMWVHVSPSPAVNFRYSHSLSNGQNNDTNNNNSSRLVLFKWTPLSSAAASTAAEDPPKRKFRYTPVVIVEEQRKAAKKVEPDAKTGEMDQFQAWQASKNDEPSSEQALKNETQNSNINHLDLGFCLKGHSDQVSAGQSKEDERKKTSSGGFWKIG